MYMAGLASFFHSEGMISTRPGIRVRRDTRTENQEEASGSLQGQCGIAISPLWCSK